MSDTANGHPVHRMKAGVGNRHADVRRHSDPILDRLESVPEAIISDVIASVIASVAINQPDPHAVLSDLFQRAFAGLMETMERQRNMAPRQ